MDIESSVVITRGKLVKTLGTNYDRYATLMKRWFTKEITKEEYDDELRTFLSSTQIHFHNKFILSVLSRCSNNILSSPIILSELDLEPEVKRIKLEKTNAVYKSLPITYPHDFLKEVTPKTLQDELVAKGLLIFLPDQDVMYSRMMLHAWEHELEGVEDSACKLILEATYTFARNILTAAISRRTGFRTKDGNFIHGLGTPAVNPWLRNTNKYNSNDKCEPTEIVDCDEFIHVPKLKSSPSEKEVNIAFELSLSSRNTRTFRTTPIRVDDIIDTLQVYPHLIPRYLMYSMTMEKFMLSRQHPSWEDLNCTKSSW